MSEQFVRWYHTLKLEGLIKNQPQKFNINHKCRNRYICDLNQYN